jgi:hypothetical protein
MHHYNLSVTPPSSALPPDTENIKLAKGNECSKYKGTAAIFSSSLPSCPVYFNVLKPRHVLSSCYIRDEHTRGIMGYVTHYLAWYVKLQVQNMLYYMRIWLQNIPGCHLRKYVWGQMSRLEEKNRSSTFVLTVFISFGLTHTICLPASSSVAHYKLMTFTISLTSHHTCSFVYLKNSVLTYLPP